MAAQWEAGRVKAQLRLTAQRLGQLQDRLESQAQITQRDIATLLQQGNIALARAKAQKQMREDIRSNLLQILEMHVGVILGHLNELERSDMPSPIVIEAASSIIYAGQSVESKDLHQVREFLMQALSPEFTRSALENRDNYVSPKVLRAVAAPPPTAVELDMYLYKIAGAYNVHWLPDLSPQQKVNALSSMLDPEIDDKVDLPRLRSLCSHGLPAHPPWLRPRVWKLLLGTLPLAKSNWRIESQKQRDNYYDLVRRLLEPLNDLPEPTEPLAPTDQAILDVANELSTVPRSLLASLEEEPEPCPQCPLDDSAPEDIKIPCAGNVDARLKVIRSRDSGEATAASPSDTPEIRLDTTPEIRLDATPEVRLEEASPTKTRPDKRDTLTLSLPVPDSPSSTHSGMSTTLLASRPFSAIGAHPKHYSALLRLLYIHSCLNPANRSPQIASLLVPIYAAFVEEVDDVDLVHIEADAFWVFESMIGEFAELEDEQNGAVWVQKLSERLRWADAELADDLSTKGLDPGLPHYSFRWLIPLLTHTLPLPAVLMVWDALFSRPMRERDANPKLDYLMDVCTSMLVCARATLLQLGRKNRKSQNLWSDEVAAIPSTAFGERELEDAFIEGMAFLTQYPLDAVGGIEKVLQTAYDLAAQREASANAAKTGTAVGLGARLRDTVWKGFSNLESHPEEDDETDEESTEEEEDHEKSAQNNSSTLTARLANTVWRGITNQSAMEAPSPSPSPTPSPVPSPLPSPLPTSQSAPALPPKEAVVNAAARGKSMIWGYAEKLKDSDAAATLAKVSTNWRVKALDAWTRRGGETSGNTLAPPSASRSAPSIAGQDHGRSISLTAIQTSVRPSDDKRGSLPVIDRSDVYSPPPRPIFRPVRDSMYVASPVSRSDDASPVSDTGSITRESLKASLSSFKMPEGNTPTRTHSGPRPLLLSSSTLLTGSTGRSPISPASESRWADSVRSKRPSVDHRASQSSISSLSPSEPYRPRRAENRSDLDSDSGSVSRIVPIHRKSPSPMARISRASRHEESTSSVSPPTPPSKSHRRLSTEDSASEATPSPRGWGRVDEPESPPTAPSPPVPGTPDTGGLKINTDVSASHIPQRSVTLNDDDVTFASPAPAEGKLTRRSATISRVHREAEFSDSSATEPHPSTPHVRRKRFPPRLQSLKNSKSSVDPPPLPTNNNLLVIDAPEEGEHENSKTPRAGSFDQEITAPPSPRSRRTRKISGETETRPRKISTEGRTRKISNESRRKVSAERETKHKRESAAVEGDDEGYGELLSAYESEDAA